MFIQTREFGYGMDFEDVAEGMKKWKASVEKKYPDIRVTLMYNLAGERGRMTVQTTYPTLADYERFDAEMDHDEGISALLMGALEHYVPPMVDQFYRVVS